MGATPKPVTTPRPSVWTRVRRLYAFVAHQVFTIVLLLVGLELATRWFLPPITPVEVGASTLVPDGGREPFFRQHPFAAHAWIPHARIGAQTVNADGFVSTRAIPLEKAANELRVVALGGSSTAGTMNRDEETYPRVLETLLQARRPSQPVSVINAAAGGYTTMESLGYFQRRMVYYEPDIVLIMHAWNEMYYFALNDRQLSERRKHLYDKAQWTPWNISHDLRSPVTRALGWSQLYLHLHAWLEANQYLRGGSPEIIEVAPSDDQPAPTLERKPINPTAYDTYRTNLEQIRSLCTLRGMTCYAILQPTLLAPNAERGLPVVERAWKTAMVHGFDAEAHIAAFDRLYAINREVFGEDHCIDATEMSGDATMFFDHIHMNARGTRRLAEIVVQAIETRALTAE